MPPVSIYDSVAPGGSAEGGQAIIVGGGYINWSLNRNGWLIQVTYLNGWPHCSLTEAVDAGHVRITFSDSGCGIPAESLEKIFEPFYTTKARGTGLGLAITRQIIEQHHGEIHIDSTVGKGTSVTVTLPTEREEL